MQLKKRFAIILSILLAFTLTACNTDDKDDENVSPTATQTTVPETQVETETFTVSFYKNADDASGETKSVSGKKNEKITLTENGFTREGYSFTGWNTKSDGKGANYSNKATFKLTQNLNLYALWSKDAVTEPEPTPTTEPEPTPEPETEPTTEPETPVVSTEYTVGFQNSANSCTYSNGVYTMQIATATAEGAEWQNQIFIANPNSGLGLSAGDTIRATVTAKADKAISAFFFKDEFNKNSYTGIDNTSGDKSIAANVEKTFTISGEVKSDYSDSLSRLVIDLRGNQADTTLILSNIKVEKVVVKSSVDASGSTDGTSVGTAKRSFTASSPANESSFTNLVWSDEFEGSSLKSENWQLEVGPKGTWYNNELQGYTNGDNVAVKDGCLVITAKEDLTSTRMKSQDKKYFTYGKLTARIKMSNGHGSWPAFWMLGQNIGTNEWPRCGEIDIMEHANSDTYIYNTLHWNTAGWQSGAAATHAYYGTKTHETAEVAAMDVSEWHEYTCVWTESNIKMYVDGVQTFVMSIAGSDEGIAAFHKPFFVLFNFAMGGDFMGEYNSSTFTNLPWQMYVDYIRLYQ